MPRNIPSCTLYPIASVISFLTVFFLAPTQFAYCQLPEDTELITSHMEFLGYSANKHDSYIEFIHPTRLDFNVEKYKDGLLLTVIFLARDNAATNDLLPLINTLNQQSALTCHYISKANNFIACSYYPGSYERMRFAIFFEHASVDFTRILQHYEILEKYFK